VTRATARADELSPQELVTGRQRLLAKIKRYRPGIVAILGIGAYRTAFGQPQATLGPQPEHLGNATIWVLPNPSGLNAHYSLERLAELFREVKQDAERNL
jgi:TDG/mug DNA glycosylase family protein